MRKRLATALAAVALLLSMTVTASAEPPVSTYEVTITNLTSGQPFTPPLVATHRKSIDLFDVGLPASHEIQQIAENGNLDPAVALATGSSKVFDAQVVLGEVPPLLPGASRTFTVSAVPGAKNLTWVSMLICTNDGFTGLDTLRLPKNIGDGSVHYTSGYDAGTEINTETWSDLVPPCAPLTGFGDQGGTGMTNPDLAEGGVIAMHPGIAGAADLDPAVHGWTGPVARVEITRTS
jgi:hypothetical protein